MRVAGLAVVAVLGAGVLCALTSRSAAQGTTSTLRGTVERADDDAPVAEVEVTLVDESTGRVKTASTSADGSFAFTNLGVGGPYHVIATGPGFKSAEVKDLILSANQTREVTLGLHLQEAVVELAGAATAPATSNRTVVSAAEIDALPSIERDPRDLARRNPEVSVEGRDHTLSIGGQNTRYNSITVDGIREDDDFGLSTSGYPTRRSPIALSAIQELTVDSSPFDVRYGKFLGGNVNIVTRSGTNEVKGTLIGTYASDALLGNRSRDNRVNIDFRELRYGATVGGPIIKDKLHFLLSAEGLAASTPTSVGPAGSPAATIASKVSPEALQLVQQIAKDVYNFDAGVPSQPLKEADFKLFGKLDWAIDKQNRVTVSYQRTGGSSIQQAAATDTTLPLTSDWYDARDTLNVFSDRLLSDWSDQLSTDVELSARLVASRAPPLGGNGFMQATINTQMLAMDKPTGGRIIIGPDELRHASALDNDSIRGKAAASYLVADHLVTAGFEYELLRINHLSVPASNGVVQYASITDFMTKNPSSIRYANAVTLNPGDGAAKWNTATWTGYAQDQLRITPELTVQAGARLEVYTTGDRITRNQNFVDRYADTLGIENTTTLDGRKVVMPRLGLSYLPIDRLNLRAGAGLYSGGSPSAWVSSAYSNDGVRINSVTVSCPNANPAICPNPALIQNFDGRNLSQGLKDLIQAGNGNVDLIDPSFQIPQAWKLGLGADYSFDIPGLDLAGKDVELVASYTFTKVRHGINWVDLRRNLAILPDNLPIGVTPDGRPLYPASFNVQRGYDLMLTNDDHGYGHVASLQVQKGFPFGLFVSGSYAYQDVHEINPGASPRSVSNYGQTAVGDPNDPTDAIASSQRKHRLTAAIEYAHPVVGYFTDAAPWKELRTAIGMFVESRSGQPFSWSFGATENGREALGSKLARIFGEDTTFASSNRELFYVPTAAQTCLGTPGAAPADPACLVVLSDGTAMGAAAPTRAITLQQFNTFLARTGLDRYRGQIAPRNAFHSPWLHRLDLRIAQDLPNPLTGHRARFVVDIENLGNLLDHNWGRAQAVPFPYIAPAVDLDYDRVNNKYNYSNLKSTNPTTVDILQSVWRVSLGLMYDF